ncbi:hypothetical protein [Shewanella sp.]|uniref:hypothetical protein n=1 Tax=Shewanella sp. TaxID=50422 RepID=UPI0035633132
MKFSFIPLLLIISTQVCSAQEYDDEIMYDLGSKFKDLSKKVDGYVKFSPGATKENASVLEKSGVNTIIQRDFSGYVVKVDVQGSNVVMLLCENDVALIEDAGCNAELDKALWKSPKVNSCEIALDSFTVCGL